MNIKQLFENVNIIIQLEMPIELESDYILSRNFIRQAAFFKGELSSQSSIVKLTGVCTVDVETLCDRCAKQFTANYNIDIEHIIVKSLNDEVKSDFIVVENEELDIEDLLLTDLILSMPNKYLCDEGCKGICSGCGRDLNLEKCQCCQSDIDPRLEVLAKLLEDK